MGYAYLKINGIASDLRFVADGYTPAANEIIGNGEPFPPLASLHDPAVLANCIAKGLPTNRKLADLPVVVAVAAVATEEAG